MPDVQVTNHNTFPLPGRYDGKSYTFPPDVPVSIPEAAAIHIFALGEENKTGAYNRLGLLRPGHGTLESAAAAIANVEFQEGRTVFDNTPLPRLAKEIGEAHSPGAPNGADPGGGSEARRGRGRPRKNLAAGTLEEEVRELKRKRNYPIGG